MALSDSFWSEGGGADIYHGPYAVDEIQPESRLDRVRSLYVAMLGETVRHWPDDWRESAYKALEDIVRAHSRRSPDPIGATARGVDARGAGPYGGCVPFHGLPD